MGRVRWKRGQERSAAGLFDPPAPADARQYGQAGENETGFPQEARFSGSDGGSGQRSIWLTSRTAPVAALVVIAA